MNEFVITKKLRWEYMIPGVMYCAASLAQAARGQIIAFLFAGILMYWILRRRHDECVTNVKFSTVVCIILVFAGGLTLFAMANELVGRTTTKTPLDSLMTYVGGSIIGLDMFLHDPPVRSSLDIVGYETFRGLYSFIGRTFDIPQFNYSFQLEYRFAGMVNIGNLYSAYRYYMNDFGIAGVIVFPAIQGFFFGAAYRRLTISGFDGAPWRFGAAALSFSYLALSIAYLPISDYFFHQYLNPTTLLTLIMIAGAVWLLGKTAPHPEKNLRQQMTGPINNRGLAG